MPQPRKPGVTPKLDSADLIRLASTDERFARALLQEPETFRGAFNLSDREIEMVTRLPDKLDLQAEFSYDA